MGGSAVIQTDSAVIDAAIWQAVLRRDRGLDGKFVYAALTTGIYCRPSCPARHPHRRNTLIFRKPEEAEREGFVACRRCYPGSDSLAPAEKSVKIALDYIETHIAQKITLRSLSQVTGLSPNHLQRKFRRIVGLSPKAFCDTRRLFHLKERLRQGQSISSATYAAGYGSSRALYEKASKAMGMTPATYARGGSGLYIHYTVADSDMGPTLMASTEQGVCAVSLGEDDRMLAKKLGDEFPNAVIERDRASPGSWLSAIRSCRVSDPLLLKLSRDLQRRVFQARLWKTLGKLE